MMGIEGERQPKGGEIKMANTREKYNPTLAPADVAEIPDITREGKAQRIIEEFLNSGMSAATVTDGAKTFAASLNRNIKRSGVPVEVVTRQGVVYLRLLSDAEVEARAEKWAESEAEGE
jgi:hypothetical protein